MIDDIKCSFPHELLLTNRQAASLCKAFANHSSTDIKLSKTQLSKMIQTGGLPLIRNVIKPLAKSVLIPLGLIAAASAADAGIHKKILGSGNVTLVISINEIEDIIKIAKSLGDSFLLLEGITGTVQNEVQGQKGGFLSMLLGTLGSS